MGIPVIDIASSHSFASQHPVLAGLVILALIAVAVFALWVSRKLPEHMWKLRVWMLAAYVVLFVGANWTMLKPEPSLLSQIQDAAHQAQLRSEQESQ